jgi:hypothetical protein
MTAVALDNGKGRRAALRQPLETVDATASYNPLSRPAVRSSTFATRRPKRPEVREFVQVHDEQTASSCAKWATCRCDVVGGVVGVGVASAYRPRLEAFPGGRQAPVYGGLSGHPQVGYHHFETVAGTGR